MATRLMDESAYKKHQAKYGRSRDRVGATSDATQGSGSPGAGAVPRASKFDAQAEINTMIKRRSKFGNVKTVVDGVKFDSKREAKRYRELGLLLKAGEIDFLARQVRFLLTGGVEYVADFVYGTISDPRNLTIIDPVVTDLTLEDAKGHRTREFINKKKQVKALFGIDVVEV